MYQIYEDSTNHAEEHLISGHLLGRRGCSLPRKEFPVPLVELQLVLCLETGADGAIGDICNAIGDNGSIVEERHVCKHGHQPANAVEILREEHTGDDAVVAFGVLDLKRILEHKASGRDGEGEAHSNLQNGTQLRTSLFTAGTTARHATTAAAVT